MDDPESEMLSGKYYEPNEMRVLFKNTNIFFLSLKHHFCSISLWRTLKTYNWTQFQLFGISESRLKLNQNPLASVQLPGYKRRDKKVKWIHLTIFVEKHKNLQKKKIGRY